MQNKEIFYKKQIKEDLLKGSLKDIEAKLKQIEQLKTFNDNADLQDELWLREMALYNKKNKFEYKLNKLLNADIIKADKLNKKLNKLYIKLDDLNHQPRFTGSFYIDVTREPEINKTKRKISKLSDKVTELGGTPTTLEGALSAKNNKVSVVNKFEIQKVKGNKTNISKPKTKANRRIPSSEKLYMPVEKTKE